MSGKLPANLFPNATAMASSSSAAAATANGERQTGTTTPMTEECKRLRSVQELLSDLWQDEVRLYENSPSSSSSPSILGGLGVGDVGQHAETRNRPNRAGTVENRELFPYRTALYPLLDCYDSIRDGDDDDAGPGGDSASIVVRPSPAPAPFEFDGHRRSRRTPRLDRHGVRIEELAALEEHLPNSAWAIRRLMPRGRRDGFADAEREAASRRGEDGGENPGDQAAPIPDPDGNDIQDAASRHNNNRFWNVLTDPSSEAAPFAGSDDDVSVPPAPEAEGEENNIIEGEDAAEEEDGGEWEDVDDDEEEDEQHVGSGDAPANLANSKNARDFSFLRWWQRSIIAERRGNVAAAEDAKMPALAASAEGSSPRPPATPEYSPEGLLREGGGPSSAALVLLRVLKHSLSDLQREFRLARAVVLLLADWRLCDVDERETARAGRELTPDDRIDCVGLECLRRVLAVVSSEYVPSCGGYCHEWYISNGGPAAADDDEYEDVPDDSAALSRPNHYCSDWWEFLGSLSTLIAYGIEYMTRDHANVLCSVVIQEIYRASSSAVPAPGGDGDGNGGEAQTGKAYLKQNIYFLNNAEQSEGGLPQDGARCKKISTNFILTILSALRQHAVSDREKLVKLLDQLDASNGPDAAGDREGVHDEDTWSRISKTLESFRACVDTVVDIGERCLLRLPTNVPSRSIGGAIVRGLVESHVGSEKFSLRADRPLSYLAPRTDSGLRGVVDPGRYSDAVANASGNPLLDPGRARNANGGRSLEELIGFQPPKDVQDIVKGLFMRDLVDLQVSGCGYGDFLSWCHLPISPEPLLVDYISNFPNNLGSADPGAHQHNHWVVDEDETELDYAHLSARYDFSLLVFFRQWNSPWTPESHLSFSIPHRRAISTLALCAHRYGVPADISILVNSFLPRSWWPDDRRCCWCRDCQLRTLKEDFHSKISSRQSNWDSHPERAVSSNLESEKGKKSLTLITCPGCQIATACSKDHLKYLHQDGHKRYCGLPPFRAPFGAEDNALCQEILGENEDICPLANDDDENGGEEDDEIDDDGSWESVDSDDEFEETMRSRSDVIFSFFNDKSYKLQRREALPFANFF